MATEHILTLDAGTSGGRAAVLQPGAGVLAVARTNWEYDNTPEIGPFGQSFDPERFWAVLCELSLRAMAEAGIAKHDIAVVGVTSQRQGIVVVDKDGHSLMAGPNIDARAIVEGLTIDSQRLDQVYDATAKLPSLLMAPARMQWLRKHDADAFGRAVHVLTIGDWLAYRLSGAAAAERSLAGDCGLLNIPTRERDDRLLDDLEFPREMLPPLVDGGTLVGEVTSQAASEMGLGEGTPVVIGGADTQCALYGMGVEEPADLGIAAGWSVTAQLVTSEARLDAQRRSWAGVHVRPDRWVCESSCSDAGSAWRWWCETVTGKGSDSLEEAAALAAKAAPGSGDVAAFLGPARMNAAAMGPRLGGVLLNTPLTIANAGRPELLRAGLENIAFALRANVLQAEEVAGIGAARIAIGGGMTRAAIFPQIVADVLGRPIEAAQEPEVTACGAARLAARAVGLPDDTLRAPSETLEPDARAIETYKRSYERWLSLRETLDAKMQELP